jgi:hypothetical protein
MSKFDKSAIMNTAHTFRKDHGWTMSAALREAWIYAKCDLARKEFEEWKARRGPLYSFKAWQKNDLRRIYVNGGNFGGGNTTYFAADKDGRFKQFTYCTTRNLTNEADEVFNEFCKMYGENVVYADVFQRQPFDVAWEAVTGKKVTAA